MSLRVRLSVLLWLLLVSVPACERGGSPAVDAGEIEQPTATDAAADVSADTAGAVPSAEWPAAGRRIDIVRDRRFDLTRDGAAERVVVRVTGRRYDSLDVALRIESADGVTLWADAWHSSYYFHYDTTEGMTEEEVARVVREHVDRLTSGERFHARGMPPRLIGSDPSTIMAESVRYHLAELDWRRAASLDPADPTPPEADRRIQPERVGAERVNVVVDELSRGPTYNYFAGGEATYVIGWSVREQAFVRLFACC